MWVTDTPTTVTRATVLSQEGERRERNSVDDAPEQVPTQLRDGDVEGAGPMEGREDGWAGSL